MAVAFKASIGEKVIKDLEYLDRSGSFNLESRGIDPKEDVLERIAIALWSKKSFQQAEHWLHWYLRVAGAFELALLILSLETSSVSATIGQLHQRIEAQKQSRGWKKSWWGGRTSPKFRRKTNFVFAPYLCPKRVHLLEI